MRCMTELMGKLKKTTSVIKSVPECAIIVADHASSQAACKVKGYYPGKVLDIDTLGRSRAAKARRNAEDVDERPKRMEPRLDRRSSNATSDRSPPREVAVHKGKGKSKATDDPSQAKLNLRVP